MLLTNLWLIILCLIATVGFFWSIWIVVSAPKYFLLPLGVSAPEISPLLAIANAIAFAIAVWQFFTQFSTQWLLILGLIGSFLGFILSLLPWLQLPATNRQFQSEFQAAFGRDCLVNIPQSLQAKMRPRPFIWLDLIRSIVRSPLKSVRIEREVVFARPDNVALKLNLYRPLKSGKYPTIVVIYGGAWRSGSPNNDEQFSCYLAYQGYCVVSVDYRHAPQYKFPIQLEDINAALNYIDLHAEKLESDRDKIALLGRSAGGHLALLAAYQQTSIPLQAVISYYGPINLTEAYQNPPVPDPINTRAVLQDFLGNNPQQLPDLYQQASPINYVRANLPPTLLIYPQRDCIVAVKYGQQLGQKLKDSHNLTVYLEIPWAEHAFDAIFLGLSNQLVLYYTERFLANIFTSPLTNPTKE
jgi:acetyl esterase/lipase